MVLAPPHNRKRLKNIKGKDYIYLRSLILQCRRAISTESASTYIQLSSLVQLSLALSVGNKGGSDQDLSEASIHPCCSQT